MILKRLFWQFYTSFILTILIVLLAISFYASKSFSNYYLQDKSITLHSLAVTFESQFADNLRNYDYTPIDIICKEQGPKIETRITIILPDGRVVADSDKDPSLMLDHSKRPEIVQALAEGIGTDTRPSDTMKAPMMYLAIPVKVNGETIAILRTSEYLDSVHTRMNSFYLDIVKYGILIAVIATAICLFISRQISKPLENIKRGADLFAKGNFDYLLEVPKSEELGSLATAMNRMAKDLSERIGVITTQKNETEAILSSMVEGVIALDTQGHIISINQAACDLLGTEKDKVTETNIEESIRNSKLQSFVKKTMSSEIQIEEEIHLLQDRQLYLHVYGKSLATPDKQQIGAIVVLHDITRLRQLENIRSEFVANVSHELKTPITSIKGFVETLLDGDINEPEQAKKFLNIVARQTNRLNAIIEDILILSKIEAQTEKNEIVLEKGQLNTSLEAAVEICELKAKEKNISINIVCPPIETLLNDFLLEQAIVNIISNAVKYSDPDKTIKVSASKNTEYVSIVVQDQGFGIPEEHLGRIFERFYVTDKARSRHLGGTGLGLAIVKHIAQAHGGYVSVSSEVGIGSTFEIHIPNR